MLKVVKEDERYLVSLFQVNKLNTLFSELISQQLNGLVSVPGREVIFNLERIRFIDSAGFEVLRKAAELARVNGSSFRVCNIGEELQELVDLTGMNKTLEVISCLEVKEHIVMELEE